MCTAMHRTNAPDVVWREGCITVENYLLDRLCGHDHTKENFHLTKTVIFFVDKSVNLNKTNGVVTEYPDYCLDTRSSHTLT